MKRSVNFPDSISERKCGYVFLSCSGISPPVDTNLMESLFDIFYNQTGFGQIPINIWKLISREETLDRVYKEKGASFFLDTVFESLDRRARNIAKQKYPHLFGLQKAGIL